jgi:hypothetical protein
LREEISPKNHTADFHSMPERTFTHPKTGAPAKMNTAAIGKKPAAPPPGEIVSAARPEAAPQAEPRSKAPVSSGFFLSTATTLADRGGVHRRGIVRMLRYQNRAP